jgi:hypothetical protein
MTIWNYVFTIGSIFFIKGARECRKVEWWDWLQAHLERVREMHRVVEDALRRDCVEGEHHEDGHPLLDLTLGLHVLLVGEKPQ